MLRVRCSAMPLASATNSKLHVQAAHLKPIACRLPPIASRLPLISFFVTPLPWHTARGPQPVANANQETILLRSAAICRKIFAALLDYAGILAKDNRRNGGTRILRRTCGNHRGS